VALIHDDGSSQRLRWLIGVGLVAAGPVVYGVRKLYIRSKE